MRDLVEIAGGSGIVWVVVGRGRYWAIEAVEVRVEPGDPERTGSGQRDADGVVVEVGDVAEES